MKKYSESIEILKVETVTYSLANCIKCNSENIKLLKEEVIEPKTGDYIYQIGGVCNDCNNHIIQHKSKENFITKLDSVNLWNQYNDVDYLIREQESLLESARIKINERIEELKTLKKR